EHGFELGPADLAAEPVYLVVGDWTELTLHFLGNFDAEFGLQQIRHSAFAGLAVDADDFAVFPADIRRIDRQVGDIPLRLASAGPFGEALLNRVLVRAAEGGEDQFAGVRLARRHFHAGAALVNFAQRVKITEIEAGIDSMHVEIERDGDDIEVAGAFAIAE